MYIVGMSWYYAMIIESPHVINVKDTNSLIVNHSSIYLSIYPFIHTHIRLTGSLFRRLHPYHLIPTLSPDPYWYVIQLNNWCHSAYSHRDSLILLTYAKQPNQRSLYLYLIWSRSQTSAHDCGQRLIG